MSTSTVTDAAWQVYPYTWRNNRGCLMAKGQQVRYGIPEPRPHKQMDGKFREDDDAMKGGDRIGFTEVTITLDMVGSKLAVFTNIEIKGTGDILKSGQLKFHDFILDHGGISEIWKEHLDGTIEIIKEKT